MTNKFYTGKFLINFFLISSLHIFRYTFKFIVFLRRPLGVVPKWCQHFSHFSIAGFVKKSVAERKILYYFQNITTNNFCVWIVLNIFLIKQQQNLVFFVYSMRERLGALWYLSQRDKVWHWEGRVTIGLEKAKQCDII